MNKLDEIHTLNKGKEVVNEVQKSQQEGNLDGGVKGVEEAHILVRQLHLHGALEGHAETLMGHIRPTIHHCDPGNRILHAQANRCTIFSLVESLDGLQQLPKIT